MTHETAAHSEGALSFHESTHEPNHSTAGPSAVAISPSREPDPRSFAAASRREVLDFVRGIVEWLDGVDSSAQLETGSLDEVDDSVD